MLTRQVAGLVRRRVVASHVVRAGAAGPIPAPFVRTAKPSKKVRRREGGRGEAIKI